MGRHTSRVHDEVIGVALELVERIGTEAPTLREHGSHSSSTLSSPLHQIAGHSLASHELSHAILTEPTRVGLGGRRMLVAYRTHFALDFGH